MVIKGVIMAAMVFNYKKHWDWVSHLHIVFQLGLTMVGCIAFCFFVGRYLDLWLGTKGVMVTIFTILGVVGGAVTAYRQIQEIIKDEKQGTEKQP
jgi:ATP synthase protein I